MDIRGSETIPAPVEAVWAVLNDAEILRQCIPGCESLDWVSGTELTASVAVKLGPFKVRFEGRITLSNLDPPHSYTISGEGKGGLMGFAKGAADVTLRENGPNLTVLTYVLDGDVGGRLAKLGSKLVGSTLGKLSDHFFSSLGAKAAERSAA